MKLLEKKYQDKIDNIISVSIHAVNPPFENLHFFTKKDWDTRLLVRINRSSHKINCYLGKNSLNYVICSPKTYFDIIVGLEGFSHSYVDNFIGGTIVECGRLYGNRVFIDYSKAKRSLLLETKKRSHIIFDDKILVFNEEGKVGDVIVIEWGDE